MDHRQFENNLQREDPLSPEMEQAWQYVRSEFHAAGMVQPPSGFVNRFQARLAERRARENRRQALLLLGISWLIASVLVVIFAFQAWASLPTPTEWLVHLVNSIASMFTFMKVIVAITTALANTLPAIIPGYVLTGVGSSVGALFVLWALRFRRTVLQQEFDHENV
ncbi:MAG: hypothetical protein JXB38_04855 [Anaerolineales bacterium]|nr:hypothetical protein [Anaerolineales bacterium]